MYVNAPRYLLRKYCVLKLINDLPRGEALDIGCGGGDLCETLYKLGYDVKGIDYSEDAIALCRERVKHLHATGLRFEHQDIHDVSETFDVVFFTEVLEHIEDDEAALAKVYELVNPGGHLVLSVPAHKDRFGPSDRYVGHFRRYDKDELISLLERHQFKIEAIWCYGVPIANITEAIRNIIYARRSVGSREEGTKQSGINRNIEARFRFLLNDVVMYPFFVLQMLFRSTNLGTGFIVKASK